MFNIGGWELVFILLLVLLLWKPEELQDRARQLGRWWARVTRSPWWVSMMTLRQRTEDFLREAAREANVELALREATREGRQIWPPEDDLRATRAFQPPAPHPEAGPPTPAPPANPAQAAEGTTPPRTSPAAAEPVPPNPPEPPEAP